MVARVNGTGIARSRWEAEVARNLDRYTSQGRTLPPRLESRIRESVLQRLIDDTLIAQTADQEGVVVEEDEVDAALSEYMERFGSRYAFEGYLERSQNTEQNIRIDLRRNMLRDRLVAHLVGEIEVSEEEIESYYRENQHRFITKAAVRVGRIVMRCDEQSGRDCATPRRVLERLRKQAVSGADFGTLAGEHSQDDDKKPGGDLGWVTRGRLPGPIDAVVFQLPPGSVSDVLESKGGLEVFKVFETRSKRQRPFSEVRGNIHSSLVARRRNGKRRDVLKDLQGRATIEVLWSEP